MTGLALSFVLLAALTHATWNYFAKSAVASRHFVWLYSLGSVILYAPLVAWLLYTERPEFTPQHWMALGATSVLHSGTPSSCRPAIAHRICLRHPIARGTGPLLSFIGASIFLGEQPTALSIVGLVFIVAGILLVAGLTRSLKGAASRHRLRFAHRRVHRGVHRQRRLGREGPAGVPVPRGLHGQLRAHARAHPVCVARRTQSRARSAHLRETGCGRHRFGPLGYCWCCSQCAWLRERRGTRARARNARRGVPRITPAEGTVGSAAHRRRRVHRRGRGESRLAPT